MNRTFLILGGGLLATAVLLWIAIGRIGTDPGADSGLIGGAEGDEAGGSVATKSGERDGGPAPARRSSKGVRLGQALVERLGGASRVAVTEALFRVQDSGRIPTTMALPVERWTVKGYTTDEGLAVLNELNTEGGVAAFFAEQHATTAEDWYATDPTNEALRMTLMIRENQSHSDAAGPADEAAVRFPYAFEVRVFRGKLATAR